ncbi:MAG: PTS system nitrogen regulatory IIA component [Pirellulaceae bacterium]|jgi:PTS system nitrogen regulatory IIA component
MFSFRSTPKPSGITCSRCAEALPLPPAYPPNDVKCTACGWSHWYPQRIYSDLPFLLPQAEISDLRGTTDEQVIDELLRSLVSASAIAEENRTQAQADLMRRERLSSTGIGHGVAVPHLRVPYVNQETGLVARSIQGVDYNSQDGAPVHVFVLLFTHHSDHVAHLHGLEKITRHLRKALALSVGQ